MKPVFLTGLTCFAMACSPELSIDSATLVRCDANRSCPAGFICLNELRCIEPDLVDTAGPAMLSPGPNDVVTDKAPVLFVWQEVPGARGYVLTVARDAALSQPVAGTPLSLEETSASLEMPVGLAYWSVIADVTSPPSPRQGRPLAVLGDTVYVYCAAGVACDAGADELGLAEAPYRSVNRAIDAASVLGVGNVAVAKRAGDLPYDESITVASGIGIEGGYDAAFTGVSGRTRFVADNVALFAARVTEPTTVSGLSLTGTAGLDRTSNVIRLIGCSSALELRDLSVTADNLISEVIRVEDGVDTAGPLLADTLVEGVYAEGRADFVNRMALVRMLSGGALRLQGVTLTGRSGAPVGLFAAIDADNSALEIADSMLSVSNGPGVVGITVAAASRFSVRGTTVEVSDSTDNAVGIVAAGSTDTTIDATTIVMVRDAMATGLNLAAGPTTNHVTSSVIRVDGSIGAAGIAASGASVIANNTIICTAGSYGDGIFVGGVAAILNNLIVTESTSCAYGTPCLVGIHESTLGGQPIAFFNNAIVGFEPTGALCGYYASGATCLADVNDARTGLAAVPPVAGNFTGATLAALGVASTLRPAGTSPLVGVGHDPNADDCVTTPPLANASVPTPTCGPVANDRDGRLRPQLPTIGAYEPE